MKLNSKSSLECHTMHMHTYYVLTCMFIMRNKIPPYHIHFLFCFVVYISRPFIAALLVFTSIQRLYELYSIVHCTLACNYCNATSTLLGVCFLQVYHLILLLYTSVLPGAYKGEGAYNINYWKVERTEWWCHVNYMHSLWRTYMHTLANYTFKSLALGRGSNIYVCQHHWSWTWRLCGTCGATNSQQKRRR